jgi:hypothetical protein
MDRGRYRKYSITELLFRELNTFIIVPLWFHLTKDEALLRKTNIEGTANIVNFVSTKG